MKTRDKYQTLNDTEELTREGSVPNGSACDFQKIWKHFG